MRTPRTIKFVYCPPGISWENTLESDARTFASKHWYRMRTCVQYKLSAWMSA